ncbi:biotin/lipoate A/B protein ligase family protein [Streptomyces sp. CG1]|uniref:lipoate--protein ligase family protein n=1 Tax=Streptomyces sp. CG1 TaxID=1287523 RepID=UPI0034E2BA40
MHGEYKVPGGKLVVVDVAAEAGVLRHVRVAGDFFLEPDEALDAVNGALEGAPADTDAAGLAARIDAALPAGTVMYGLTSEGVAIAVRRALARATDWTDYDWQLIHEGPQPPALHMALDEVLTAEVAAGRRLPTLVVWEWGAPAVIIGSFQPLRNEVDPEGAARHGIEVVRRISGGGAMFVATRPDRATRSPDTRPQLSHRAPVLTGGDHFLGRLGALGHERSHPGLRQCAEQAAGDVRPFRCQRARHGGRRHWSKAVLPSARRTERMLERRPKHPGKAVVIVRDGRRLLVPAPRPDEVEHPAERARGVQKIRSPADVRLCAAHARNSSPMGAPASTSEESVRPRWS